MSDDRYEVPPTNYAQRMNEMFVTTERMRDFLEWIFDTQIEWMTQGEAWDEFEKHEQSKEPKI